MRIIPKYMTNNQVLIKSRILGAALNIIPFKGWNKIMLEEASASAGFDEKLAFLVFPGGVNDLLEYYLATLDQEMLDIVLPNSQTLKIREKVYEALAVRLQLMAKRKALTIKTFTYLSLPWNLGLSAKFAWRTVDLIWKEICNDSSTDFNYYTKRSLLYAVYKSTLLYWLSDESMDNENSLDFLRRRIDNVLKVGSFMAKFKTSH